MLATAYSFLRERRESFTIGWSGKVISEAIKRYGYSQVELAGFLGLH